jgi:hypothetical protein
MTELSEFILMQFVIILAVDVGAAWADISRRRTDQAFAKGETL